MNKVNSKISRERRVCKTSGQPMNIFKVSFLLIDRSRLLFLTSIIKSIISERLVVYFNFEKVLKHGRISDKSGYENSGTMTPGGEILKFNDKDYTCNQAAR